MQQAYNKFSISKSVWVGISASDSNCIKYKARLKRGKSNKAGG